MGWSKPGSQCPVIEWSRSAVLLRSRDGLDGADGMGALGDCGGKRLNFQIDAGDFRSAFALLVAGALAQFGEAQMAGLAELDSGGDEDAVDIDAGLALELE